MKKLAIVTTHPIQYNAPVFRLLTERKKLDIKVFYTWGESVLKDKFDPGFGKIVNWDIPLLDGYDFAMVNNVSKDPGTHHFKGIINPQICDDIKKWNPDCLLVIGWKYEGHFRCLRYFKRKLPVYFWGDSVLIDLEGNALKRLVKKIFLSWIYSYVDSAFYVGAESKRYFMEYGFKKGNLFFAPHAVDNERFAGNDRSLRRELGISDDCLVFLFAGKWEPKKDPLLLLEAFIELDKPQSFLLLVGNGEYESQIRRRVGGLPETLRERIRLLEFQNQSAMPRVYQACDVFVLPSKGPGETWGLAVNEAMASGRAVIVSDRCGCYPDLVDNGKNGFVFQHGNKESLLQAMRYFCTHPSTSADMGLESRRLISHWSFSATCMGIENAILGQYS